MRFEEYRLTEGAYVNLTYELDLGMEIIPPYASIGRIKSIPAKMLVVDDFTRELADTIGDGQTNYEMKGGLCGGNF